MVSLLHSWEIPEWRLAFLSYLLGSEVLLSDMILPVRFAKTGLDMIMKSSKYLF